MVTSQRVFREKKNVLFQIKTFLAKIKKMAKIESQTRQTHSTHEADELQLDPVLSAI